GPAYLPVVGCVVAEFDACEAQPVASVSAPVVLRKFRLEGMRVLVCFTALAGFEDADRAGTPRRCSESPPRSSAAHPHRRSLARGHCWTPWVSRTAMDAG